MSIESALRELGKEIQKDERFIALQAAAKVNDADENLQQQMQEMQLISLKYQQEAEKGEEAYIGVKINSLTDKTIIDELVKASRAGVKIELAVRGICCLIPEVPGETENIRVENDKVRINSQELFYEGELEN